MRASTARESRLRKRADFLRVQRVGVPVRTNHFVLLLCAREQAGPTRLGLVVTKKTGNAVIRNRIKRLCRECFRLHPPVPKNTAPKAVGLDLVVVAKPGAHELGLRGVQAEWKAAEPRLRAACEKVLGDRQ